MTRTAAAVCAALLAVTAPALARERISDGMGRIVAYADSSHGAVVRYSDAMDRPIGTSTTDAAGRTIWRDVRGRVVARTEGYTGKLPLLRTPAPTGR